MVQYIALARISDFNVTPTADHVYSNWLAKAVSSCNNCGKQCCSDNLTAAIAVSTIQNARCFAAEFAKRNFFDNRRQSVEKVSYGFLDIRNDNSSSQIAATAYCLLQLLQLETAFAHQFE